MPPIFVNPKDRPCIMPPRQHGKFVHGVNNEGGRTLVDFLIDYQNREALIETAKTLRTVNANGPRISCSCECQSVAGKFSFLLAEIWLRAHFSAAPRATQQYMFIGVRALFACFIIC